MSHIATWEMNIAKDEQPMPKRWLLPSGKCLSAAWVSCWSTAQGHLSKGSCCCQWNLLLTWHFQSPATCGLRTLRTHPEELWVKRKLQVHTVHWTLMLKVSYHLLCFPQPGISYGRHLCLQDSQCNY